MLNPERVVNPEKGGTVNWQLRLNRRFGYDGWSMVAEYSANVADPAFTAMTRVAGYAWELDLSGTLTGAGGVGELVAQWRAGQGSEGSASTLWLPCYDGNGNVTEIVAAGAGMGTVSGQWEYSAFGETVTLDGAALEAEICGLRVGDFKWVTFPGEVTVQVGLNIKRVVNDPNANVSGYTNGYIYYTATKEQRMNPGYAQEDCDVLVAPEWQQQFEERAVAVLQALAQ